MKELWSAMWYVKLVEGLITEPQARDIAGWRLLGQLARTHLTLAFEKGGRFAFAFLANLTFSPSGSVDCRRAA
jgi:hypothetical protein